MSNTTRLKPGIEAMREGFRAMAAGFNQFGVARDSLPSNPVQGLERFAKIVRGRPDARTPGA
jgi:hypothetical protein